MYPFWKFELRNHESLAVLPSTCEKNCKKTERYRNLKNACNIKKINYKINDDWLEKVISITDQTLEERVREKWIQVYVMFPKTHTPFEKKCYDFTEKVFM